MFIKISCVVPSYNDAFLTIRCLTSIVTQVQPAFEIIIVDDSSTKDVRNAIEPFLRAYPYCRYVEGARTGNPVDNWNLGIDQCQGDYVTLVHHDEWFARKDYLDSLTNTLAAGPDGSSAFARVVVVGGLRPSRVGTARALARSFRYPAWTLFALNWIGAPSTFTFPRSTKERFDRSLKVLVDVDFYFRVMQDGPLMNIEEISILSCVHSDQISAGIEMKKVARHELTNIIMKKNKLTRLQSAALKLFAHLRAVLDFRPIVPS